MTVGGKVFLGAVAVLAVVATIWTYEGPVSQWIWALPQNVLRDWIGALSGWVAALAALATIWTMHRHHKEDRRPDVILAIQIIELCKMYRGDTKSFLEIYRNARKSGCTDSVMSLDELLMWNERIEGVLFDRFDIQIGSSDFFSRTKARYLIGNLIVGIQKTEKSPHLVSVIGLYELLASYFAGCEHSAQAFRDRWEVRRTFF